MSILEASVAKKTLRVITAMGQAARRHRLLLDVVGPVIGFVIFLVVLLFVEDDYQARVMALIALWAAVGMAWNLIGGYAGQILLGNAAFVGLGAYTSVLLLNEYNITPWLGLVAAAAVCAVAAVLLGIPTLRLTGVYFSLATLAYPLVLQPVATWLGYREVLIPARSDALYAMQFRDPRIYAAMLAVLVLLIWYVTTWIERSQWFVQLQALRHDEAAARSVGINTLGLKLSMFVLSAILFGLAGVVYAQLLFVLTPTTVFGLPIVLLTLVICFLGGAGHRLGPIVGALILIPLIQYIETTFSEVAGAANLTYGLILLVVIMIIPVGLVGSRFVRQLTGRRSLVEAPLENEVSDVSGVGEVAELLGSRRGKGDPDYVIEGADLTKRYGEVVAVDDVSFNLLEGESLGLVGPNGAGKTTLFDLVTGFQEPTSGRVLFQGTDITSWRPERRARQGIRRTFQVPRILVELTVFENVFLGALHQNEEEMHSRRSALQSLEVVGLLDQANALARELRPPQLRLLELARSLAGHPTVLLLDEPFAGLDQDERRGFVDVLRRCFETGQTIVLVDHDIRTVASFVQRLFVLDNGREIANGPPPDVIRDGRVVDAYLGTRWQSRVET